MKIYTGFLRPKAKMTPYSRKKQRPKIAWTAQLFEQVNVLRSQLGIYAPLF